MSHQPDQPQPSWSDRLPSFVWIILILLGMVVLIGGVIGLFWALSSVEGFASILLLVAGAVAVFGASSVRIKRETGNQALSRSGGSIALAVGILFFAAMGMAIDQPGNVIYNLPIQWLFCPAGTTLSRGIDVSHPLPGRTNVTQDFSCVGPGGAPGTAVDVLGIIGVRFGEYLVIGYLLVLLSRIFSALRPRKFEPYDDSSLQP